MKTKTFLAPHTGTVLWEGDVAVVGATLTGFRAAVELASRGLRTCLIEPGPVLGREISGGWLDRVPEEDPVCNRLIELCGQQGGVRNGRLDPLIAALAFDQVASEVGLQAFVRVLPVRVLADTDRCVTGIEVAGRSGRHFIRVQWVLDAGPGRKLAHRTVELEPGRPRCVTRRARFVAVGDLPESGLKLTIDRNPAEIIPAVWDHECVLSLAPALPSGLPETEIAVRTYGQVLAAAAELRSSHDAFTTADLVAVAPEFLAEYPLSSDVIPSLAGTGLVPLPICSALDEELHGATEICDELASAPATPDPLPGVSSDTGPKAATWIETCELRTDPVRDLETVELPATPVTVHEPCDVLVAGYGTAGAFAALAAARHGVKVTALDPAPYPGGIGAAGNIHSYYHGIAGGIQDQLDEQISGRAAAIASAVAGYHPAARADVLIDALRRDHVTLLPGHTVLGTVKNEATVQGVLSLDARGYHLFPCSVAIDATGEGDLAAAAGAAYTLGREGDGFPQPYSYTPTMLRNGKLSHRNFDAGWMDPTDTLDYSRAHFEGRRRLWDQGPFTQAEHYLTLAAILGVRESRFVTGGLIIRFEDFLEGKDYPDAVCEMRAHYDNHAMDYANESDWARRHVTEFGLWRFHCQGVIPFRALVPVGVEGLLVACRAFSVDHDMHQLARMQRDMQKIGEIAGHAAAVAVQTGISPAKLEFAEIMKVLKSQGLPVPRKPEPQANVPVPELLDWLKTEDGAGIAMWRLSRLDPARAVDWAAFFQENHAPNTAFRAAVAAALNGHLEAARATLEDVISQRRKEPILGEKAPPAFVVAAMVLAEVQAPGSAERLGEILLGEQLDPPAALLVLKGLELAGDPTGVKYVHRFLEATKDEQFSMPLWGCGAGWKSSFRFAVELRAEHTLRALGDPGDDQRLRPYAQHRHFLIQKYARRLLAENIA